MKHANSQLAALAGTAIDAIRALVTDPDTPPAVRLRAAKLILESAPAPEDDGDGDDEETESMHVPPVAGPSGTRTPYTRTVVKVGRNEYCPCGSGIKFKKCCLGKPQPVARQGPLVAVA